MAFAGHTGSTAAEDQQATGRLLNSCKSENDRQNRPTKQHRISLFQDRISAAALH